MTDSNGNKTSWIIDGLNRVTEERIHFGSTWQSRYFDYDGYDLEEKTDRNGRVTTYDYDHLHRLEEEIWFDDDMGTSPNHTISYAYDDNSNLTSAIDGDTEYTYGYDFLNRRTNTTQAIDGLTPTVQFAYGYDAASRMTSTKATIGSTADYQNSYVYDAQNRLTILTQSSQSGGQAVSPKRVDLAYFADGQFDSLTRWASTSQSNPVATTEFNYDGAGRLGFIGHQGTATGSDFEEYHSYGFDKANRITVYNTLINEINVDYAYDATSQLTHAEDDNSNLPEEGYSYDNNGNRETANGDTYETEAHNRLASDGTYDYEYDDEGNVISREGIGSEFGHRFYYTWDHRNRLTHVSEHLDDHEVLDIVYTYDAFNQLVYKTTDKPFENGTSSTALVHDNGQVVLQFDAEFGFSPDDLEANDLSHRYLWNAAAVDQLLADEQVNWSDNSAPDGEVLWALTDNLGSVKDVVDSNGDVRIHRLFDSFGNVVDEMHYNAAGSTVSLRATATIAFFLRVFCPLVSRL